MALSAFEYVNQDTPVSIPGANYVHKLCESASAEGMAVLVQQALDEVEALNVLIAAAVPGDPNVLLSISDADLGGGGDGHTFICMLTFVPVGVNLLASLIHQSPLPENVRMGFRLASEAEALQPLIGELVQELTAQSDLLSFFQGVRGASKGTRFMVGIGGLVSAPS